MPEPGANVAREARRYRIALLDAARRGAAGERLGQGTGASLEFQDRRPYQPGDDLRHLDWRAYARTDQLFVRLYREEVSPRLDLLVDLSRSMRSDPEKERAATDLTALFLELARAENLATRVIGLGDRPELLDADLCRDRGLAFDAITTVAEILPAASAHLRRGSVRILLSDFLFPHESSALVRTVAAHCGAFALLQVLAPDDLEPPVGAARLVDAETTGTLEVVLDPPRIAAYRARLDRLSSALATQARRSHGLFLSVPAALPLPELCREHLLPGRLLAAG